MSSLVTMSVPISIAVLMVASVYMKIKLIHMAKANPIITNEIGKYFKRANCKCDVKAAYYIFVTNFSTLNYLSLNVVITFANVTQLI